MGQQRRRDDARVVVGVDIGRGRELRGLRMARIAVGHLAGMVGLRRDMALRLFRRPRWDRSDRCYLNLHRGLCRRSLDSPG